MSRGRWVGRCAAAAAALALLGGCGSTDDQERDDRDVAAAALLRASDLPAEWARQPDAGETELSPERLGQLCPGYSEDDLAFTIAGDASVSFTVGADASVTHAVTVVGDETRAREAVAGATSERAQRCIAAIVRDSVAGELIDGIRLGRIRVDPLDVTQLGVDTRALRLRMPLSGQDVDVEVQADVVVSHAEDAVSTLLTSGISGPFDERLRDRLSQRAIERLDAAVAE